MRLVTFTHNGSTQLGALQQNGGTALVFDLNRLDGHIPGEIGAFLAGGAATRQRAADALRQAPSSAGLPLSQVTLQAPVPQPGKIICIGLNYRDHAEESGLEIPDYPTVFSKYGNAIIGPEQPIVVPRVTTQVDYEGELGVVIGQRARHVSVEEALDYVGGYVPFNDVSARDYQMRTSQWTIGKTFDTFGPMGPALVTADEVPDPHDLNMRVFVNEQLVQNSNTCNLIFPIPYLVHFLSEVMTLEPGDLISTGTPAGVGFARTPPLWLRPGDTVRVEIEGVGVLQNPVVSEV